MDERELRAEIVKSGTWLYADEVLTEVWIVKQNFEYHYEPDFPSGPEEVNSDGESFQVVFARAGEVISLGPSRLSLPDAVAAAEQVVSTAIRWSDHLLQTLYGGRQYSLYPIPNG